MCIAKYTVNTYTHSGGTTTSICGAFDATLSFVCKMKARNDVGSVAPAPRLASGLLSSRMQKKKLAPFKRLAHDASHRRADGASRARLEQATQNACSLVGESKTRRVPSRHTVLMRTSTTVPGLRPCMTTSTPPPPPPPAPPPHHPHPYPLEQRTYLSVLVDVHMVEHLLHLLRAEIPRRIESLLKVHGANNPATFHVHVLELRSKLSYLDRGQGMRDHSQRHTLQLTVVLQEKKKVGGGGR